MEPASAEYLLRPEFSFRKGDAHGARPVPSEDSTVTQVRHTGELGERTQTKYVCTDNTLKWEFFTDTS